MPGPAVENLIKKCNCVPQKEVKTISTFLVFESEISNLEALYSVPAQNLADNSVSWPDQ